MRGLETRDDAFSKWLDSSKSKSQKTIESSPKITFLEADGISVLRPYISDLSTFNLQGESTMMHHLVSYCPGNYCQRQRTWTSYDGQVFYCDHCRLKMRYDYSHERLVLL
jgi:hypothetical protein